mmetsp:Transcript_157993/g.291307  ORF Transcript_157993/g.291307 Transcript_157993/m.291307 type:complete len:251 (+) Transcript_157993:1-753(+)
MRSVLAAKHAIRYGLRAHVLGPAADHFQDCVCKPALARIKSTNKETHGACTIWVMGQPVCKCAGLRGGGSGSQPRAVLQTLETVGAECCSTWPNQCWLKESLRQKSGQWYHPIDEWPGEARKLANTRHRGWIRHETSRLCEGLLHEAGWFPRRGARSEQLRERSCSGVDSLRTQAEGTLCLAQIAELHIEQMLFAEDRLQKLTVFICSIRLDFCRHPRKRAHELRRIDTCNGSLLNLGRCAYCCFQQSSR